MTSLLVHPVDKKEKPRKETEVSWRPEVIEIEAPPVSKELKKRWSYFIRKVYETDPLTCPKCQGEMWFDKLLTTLRGLEGRIISFIDLSACAAQAGQPDVIKKILQHLGLWEDVREPQSNESHAPPGRDPPLKEITFRGEPFG